MPPEKTKIDKETEPQFSFDAALLLMRKQYKTNQLQVFSSALVSSKQAVGSFSIRSSRMSSGAINGTRIQNYRTEREAGVKQELQHGCVKSNYRRLPDAPMLCLTFEVWCPVWMWFSSIRARLALLGPFKGIMKTGRPR